MKNLLEIKQTFYARCIGEELILSSNLTDWKPFLDFITVLGDLGKCSATAILRHSLAKENVARTGIEPATQGFSVLKIRFFPLP